MCALLKQMFNRLPQKFIAIGFLAILVFYSSTAWSAQLNGSATVKGTVTDKSDRQALEGTTVVLKGTSYGAITDLNGDFIIEALPSGEYLLQVSRIGYKQYERAIQLTNNQTLSVNIAIVQSSVKSATIEVIASKERQKQDDPRTSLYRIEPMQSKKLAGSVEDVLRSLQTIPGVLAQNDFSSQIFVRGSGPDQNLMVMDDIEVFNPYRLYGVISMFNPETVSSVSLITGGFPAKYGDRLSAVLDVSNRDGISTSPFKAEINASIIDANIITEGKLPFDMEGSWLISSRRTYYDLIIGPILKDAGLVEGDVAFPNFFDIQSKIALQIHPMHRLVFNAVIGRDNVDVITAERESDRPDSVNVGDDSSNDVFGAAWHFTPKKHILNKFVVSHYINSGDSRFSGTFVDDQAYTDDVLDSLEKAGIDPALLAFKAVDSESSFEFKKISIDNELSINLERHLIETGIGADFLNTSIFFYITANEAARAEIINAQDRGTFGNIPLDEVITQSTSYYRAHAYIQDRYEAIENKLFLQPGLRLDYYRLINKWYLAPRFNVSYAFTPQTTLRSAWGIYYQSPGYEKLIDQNSFFDLSVGDSFIKSLKAEQAIHYVVGLDHWLDNQWQLKLEGYYKEFNNLLIQKKETTTEYEVEYLGGDPYSVTSWTFPFAVTDKRLTSIPINEGDGDAYGIEILLEKRRINKTDRFNGWVSYALAFANRYRDDLTIPFNYDQRHTFNLVFDYKINSWLDLGIRWRYGSGFPYTPPVGVKPRVVPLDEEETVWAIQRETLLGDNIIFSMDYGDEENQNSKRLPAYHRLDIRFTAHVGMGKAMWQFYIDIINAYNNQNVIGYQYDVVPNPSGGFPLIERSEQAMLPIFPTLGVNLKF